MRTISLLAVNLILAACASQPSSGPPAATTAPAPATALAASSPTASVAEPGAAKVAAATPGEPVKAPPGYKLARRNGELLYCQTTRQVGSNLPKQICVTPQAYDDMERRMEQDRETIRRNGALCGTGGCGGI